MEHHSMQYYLSIKNNEVDEKRTPDLLHEKNKS